jgi:uncharacterized membrane protein
MKHSYETSGTYNTFFIIIIQVIHFVPCLTGQVQQTHTQKIPLFLFLTTTSFVTAC